MGTLGTAQDLMVAPGRLDVLRATVPNPERPDADFSDLAKLAASAFAAPVGLVTLVGQRIQWFTAAEGTKQSEAPADISFCIHTLTMGEGNVFSVLDAGDDPRFATHPQVAGEPHLRFYAGAAITVDGQPIGTVCVFDVAARPGVTDQQAGQLLRLARLAGKLFQMKAVARRHQAAEAAVARDEQRHAAALEAAQVGSWLWDIRKGTVQGNRPLACMFGLPQSGEISAETMFSAIDPADRPAMLRQLKAAARGTEDYDGTFRIPAKNRFVMGRGRVHERDANGKPTHLLGVTIDVTEQQTSARRTRLLLRELNHRVKNTLAMLQSLARQTLRRTSDPEQFMTAFAGRLQAISESHGLLSDHEWGSIRLAALLSKQLMPHVRDYAAQIEIHKDEIELGPDQALGLGLVLHELATNATKYGSLSVPTGKVVITARRIQEEGAEVLNLTWTEIGGPLVTEPEKRGFGSILIERSLDKVLGSAVSVSYLPSGLTALIRLPL
ncbi:PAS domain S-box-containing protein [Rhizobium sp. RU20A]|uniref:sensor histidine kinase n=1 Tax=Rhizobium sp. RU20A TaxID=1907412 RepID=UPI0009558736|nr:HWE histidine kinase domain-containing protein [Rhizobium sp. RU20A]SIQ31066.1 PAS domain S-box-containing protein [Rhizobium sp. RU20A]